MQADLTALVGLLLTVLGGVVGAAVQHGVAREKIRNLETSIAALTGRLDAAQKAQSDSAVAHAELRALFTNVTDTLQKIEADIAKLADRVIGPP